MSVPRLSSAPTTAEIAFHCGRDKSNVVVPAGVQIRAEDGQTLYVNQTMIIPAGSVTGVTTAEELRGWRKWKLVWWRLEYARGRLALWWVRVLIRANDWLRDVR